MNETSPFPLIAVDIGNARVKLGLFQGLGDERLPRPTRTLHVAGQPLDAERITAWMVELKAELGVAPTGWWIGTVNQPTATNLVAWIRQQRPNDPVTLLAADDLPLNVSVPRPDMVGIDRLLDAVAANRLRQPGRPAVVVDAGTAVTVDLLDADGTFRGGAILPGVATVARALHEYTNMLPLIDMSDLSVEPPAVGLDTESALRSGLFWGAVGSIRELVARMTRDATTPTMGVPPNPHVFLTGGAGPSFAEFLGGAALGGEAESVPHLTLAGIALAAR